MYSDDVGLSGYWALQLSDCVFFFKQKTAYEMRISDWSSDVCSSDLDDRNAPLKRRLHLGIAAPDRSRRDDHGRIAEIPGVMADHHLDAALPEPGHHIAVGDVGPLHRIAKVIHHLGDQIGRAHV